MTDAFLWFLIVETGLVALLGFVCQWFFMKNGAAERALRARFWQGLSLACVLFVGYRGALLVLDRTIGLSF